MADDRKETNYRSQSFANVWDALEDTPAEAANMTMRSDLLIALRRRIESWKVTQAEAARRLEITQPRLNDFNLANRADLHVRLRLDKAA